MKELPYVHFKKSFSIKRSKRPYHFSLKVYIACVAHLLKVQEQLVFKNKKTVWLFLKVYLTRKSGTFFQMIPIWLGEKIFIKAFFTILWTNWNINSRPLGTTLWQLWHLIFTFFSLSKGFGTKKMNRSGKSMILSTFCTTVFNSGTP